MICALMRSIDSALIFGADNKPCGYQSVNCIAHRLRVQTQNTAYFCVAGAVFVIAALTAVAMRKDKGKNKAL